MASRGIDVHPKGYHPSSLTRTIFDIIIIGAGPVANFAENRLARAGLSVAVVQHELYGGECHFFACVPSKALLRPVEALEAAKAVGGTREAIGKKKLDVDAIFERRDRIVDSWDDNNWISISNGPSGATLVRGFARIAGVKKVSIQPHGEEQRYLLDANIAVIVATGSSHVVPSIPGIENLEEGKELWINRDAVAANTVPEHLIILGAGPVGCEMATFYSAVGSQVVLVSSTAEILPKIEPQAASIVREPLDTDATLAVPVSGSTEDWLYAVGDVNGLAPTTHMGVYQARIASNAILSSVQNNQPSIKINPPIGFTVTEAKRFQNTFPQVIFTEPNISTVGHTFASAQAAGLKVRAIDSDFSIPGAWLYGDGQPGWARWVIEEETDRLVGATFCCVEGSEFVNASQVAISQCLSLREMVHVVPPFPTRGEIWSYLLNAAGY
ncbi:uncharacterized protein ALTATR162_LOCUS5053 [Alternaria atra]|uniref:FAD/NAD(P)-binding domain-containing protein n=1 Tax=Alternaria atra TaxID=119953 RepID=A0A8J2I490_9PLEO|nr:uncharacterized protein ALTATR162_LOCUS5053 [Alternaria atra]CAG5158240.1 unnamed protein product [Alternaria atra]